jgi:hypothetical protein
MTSLAALRLTSWDGAGAAAGIVGACCCAVVDLAGGQQKIWSDESRFATSPLGLCARDRKVRNVPSVLSSATKTNNDFDHHERVAIKGFGTRIPELGCLWQVEHSTTERFDTRASIHRSNAIMTRRRASYVRTALAVQ